MLTNIAVGPPLPQKHLAFAVFKHPVAFALAVGVLAVVDELAGRPLEAQPVLASLLPAAEVDVSREVTDDG